MALDHFQSLFGTEIVWGPASGAGAGVPAVTQTMSLNNLAAGAARQGASVDISQNTNADDDEYAIQASVETGTAPTSGKTCDIYLAWSDDNSIFPATVGTSDAAFPASGTLADYLKMLGNPVLSIIVTNTGNLLIIQNKVLIRPKARYVAPVFVNNMDQATRNQVTPANNLSRVWLTPKSSIRQNY